MRFSWHRYPLADGYAQGLGFAIYNVLRIIPTQTRGLQTLNSLKEECEAAAEGGAGAHSRNVLNSSSLSATTGSTRCARHVPASVAAALRPHTCQGRAAGKRGGKPLGALRRDAPSARAAPAVCCRRLLSFPGQTHTATPSLQPAPLRISLPLC